MIAEVFYFLAGALVVIAALALKSRFVGFTAQERDTQFSSGPDFDMRKHLNGPMVCDGVIFGPTGRVSSSFTAEFDVTWRGDVCTMKEVFTYNDGSVQNRAWEITLGPNGTFTARADDVRGTAKGKVAGNAVIFRYDLTLPEASGGHTLSAFDCMYLAAGGAIVNRSEFRKFGIKVAELVATIRKVEAEAANEDYTPLRKIG